MTFEAMIDQILALLKRQGRVSYSALRRRFDIDAAYLDDLKDELLYSQPQISDDGRGLIWTGDLAMPDVGARLRTEAELLFHEDEAIEEFYG